MTLMQSDIFQVHSIGCPVQRCLRMEVCAGWVKGGSWRPVTGSLWLSQCPVPMMCNSRAERWCSECGEQALQWASLPWWNI